MTAGGFRSFSRPLATLIRKVTALRGSYFEALHFGPALDGDFLDGHVTWAFGMVDQITAARPATARFRNSQSCSRNTWKWIPVYPRGTRPAPLWRTRVSRQSFCTMPILWETTTAVTPPLDGHGLDPLVAAPDEPDVADPQDFIDQQDLGVRMDRHGKAESHAHAAGIRGDG